MTPQTQNLVATFAGAAIGLLIEHNTPFALLYVGAGAVAAPWLLNQVRQRVSGKQAIPANVPDYRL